MKSPFAIAGWSRVADQVKSLFAPLIGPDVRAERVVSLPTVAATPEPTPAERRRRLPCDLYLTMGGESVRLFGAGAVEELSFFQRYNVSAHHDTEFLTRLDVAERHTENFKGFGLFRLAGAWQKLPDLDRLDEVWVRLEAEHGIGALPDPRSLLPTEVVRHRPRFGLLESGAARLSPPRPGKLWKRAGRRRHTWSDVLEIARRELTGPQRIAWIEAAMAPPPPTSPIVHRYYLDTRKQAYLVRDHRTQGKRLYLAETSDEAVSVCEASAHVRRFARSA